ncbi:MAG: tetratricopeptide repeat protein [Victivallaceae bacterium]|nr:hypothetical protein [Victivallaceae bacterium]
MARIQKYVPPAPGSKPRRVRDLDSQISSTLFDDFDRFEHFFSSHWKAFCWGGATLVVLSAIWGGLVLWQRHNYNEAAEQLNSARNQEQLIAAIAEFSPSDIVANDARMRLANLLFRAGNYNDAIAQLDAVIATDCPAEQKMQIRLNRAYLLEGSGRLADAAAAFAEVADTPAPPVRELVSESACNAGRLYREIGNADMARKYLKSAAGNFDLNAVITGQSYPFWSRLAFFMLNEMDHPSTAPAPAPKPEAKPAAKAPAAPAPAKRK